MNQVNNMVAALFVSNKSSMKYSGNSARLFIAKLTFSLMIWIWILFVIKIFENTFHSIEYFSDEVYFGWVVFFIVALITHYYTWNLATIEQVVDDVQNKNAIASAKRVLLWLFITGFVLLMSASAYYK